MAKLKTSKIHVLFLGTPEFACPTLSVLLSAHEIFEVVGVVTQPDRPAGRNMEVQKSNVKRLAEEHLNFIGRMGKRFPILTPTDVNSHDSLIAIEKLEADIAVVVAYGQILGNAFLNLFKKGAVNVHASLLPRWRGAAPIAWALLNQDSVTGVTLQKVAPKLDSGGIIATSQLVLTDDYDAPRLYQDLAHRGADVVRKKLADYLSGKIVPVPQDEKLVTWAPKIKKEQGLIDWSKTAKEICAQIKALTPWPGTWTTRQGKALKILRATPVDHWEGQPGELVGIDKINFWVQCGDNTALQIAVVQPESRGRQPAGEYMKGYPFQKGDKLGT